MTTPTLTTYQLTLRGFRGDTNETDHLIKWVNAPSQDAIDAFITRNGLPLSEPPEIMDMQCVGLDAGDRGVDCEVDEAGGIVWGRIGRIEP